jgi:hypothetical protein
MINVFVPMLYGSGMPLLYPISAISCFLNYNVDKFLLVNFYKKPMKYDTAMVT